MPPPQFQGESIGQDMKTKKTPPVFFHRRMKDDPTVQVKDNNVELAIRLYVKPNAGQSGRKVQ